MMPALCALLASGCLATSSALLDYRLPSSKNFATMQVPHAAGLVSNIITHRSGCHFASTSAFTVVDISQERDWCIVDKQSGVWLTINFLAQEGLSPTISASSGMQPYDRAHDASTVASGPGHQQDKTRQEITSAPTPSLWFNNG